MEFSKPYRADGKGFNGGRVGKNRLKSARFDTKPDTYSGSSVKED
jgi:hypothetical protein